MRSVQKGDRVQMTGVMHNDPSPLPVGMEGTVVSVNEDYGQIHVDWDVIEGQGRRSLILLFGDPFVVVAKAAADG